MITKVSWPPSRCGWRGDEDGSASQNDYDDQETCEVNMWIRMTMEIPIMMTRTALTMMTMAMALLMANDSHPPRPPTPSSRSSPIILITMTPSSSSSHHHLHHHRHHHHHHHDHHHRHPHRHPCSTKLKITSSVPPFSSSAHFPPTGFPQKTTKQRASPRLSQTSERREGLYLVPLTRRVP